MIEPERAAAFHAALRMAYDNHYDPDEGERLLLVAGERFREADDWHEWSDLELWKLLAETLMRVGWLQDIFSGRTPFSHPLPAAAVSKPHVTDKARRQELGVDKKGYSPSRANPRLKGLLSRQLPDMSTGELAVVEGRDPVEVLGHLRDQIEAAMATVEPRMGKVNAKRASRLRAKFNEVGLLTSFKGSEVIRLALDNASRPFLQGNRGVPPAIVDLVSELADSWTKALCRPPPRKRSGAERNTSPGKKFEAILRALEKAHRRPVNEIGKSAIELGLTAAAPDRSTKGAV